MLTSRCLARPLVLLLTTTSLTAVLLAGCSERRGTMYDATHQSIKDDPYEHPRSVFYRTKVEDVRYPAQPPLASIGRSAGTTRPSVPADRPATAPEPVAPRGVPKKQGSEAPNTVPGEATKTAQAAEAPAPVTQSKSAPKAAPVVVATAPPPVAASAPSIVPAEKSESRGTAEARRGAPPSPVVTLEPAAGAAVPNWTPPSVPAVEAAGPSAAVKLASKPTPLAEAPAAPKYNAGRSREMREKMEELLGSGKIIAARTMLREASRDQNPALIEALGQTYDPLVLQKYPKVKPAAADAGKAAELYVLAISKGRTEAKDRLDELRSFLNKAP